MRWLLKTNILVIIFVLLFTTTGYTQYENLGTAKKTEPKVNPWFVGGMIGGGFSNSGGYFEISPIVGYKVTQDFHVGSRLTYIYSSYNYGGTTGKITSSDYGGSLFARYRFLKFLFAHAEYEILSTYWYQDDNRRIINSLYIGGGLFQSMGRSGFATIALLYNVLETQYSPYSNPIIRIGFGVGF